MPQQAKGLLLLVLDLVLIFAALAGSFMLGTGNLWPVEATGEAWLLLATFWVSAVVFALVMRLHLTRLDALDFHAVGNIALWSLLVTATGIVVTLALGLNISFPVLVIFGLLLFILAFSVRYLTVALSSSLSIGEDQRVPVAIYGAGAGGVQLVAALRNSREYHPALLVDDSKHLQGLNIAGLRVHKPKSLGKFVKNGRVAKVFLAIPSISPGKKSQIIQSLASLDCEVQEIPSYVDIIQSGGVFRSLRPVQPEALLGRDGVDVNVPEVNAVYSGANILVTGGGGSIGSELCRRLLDIGPKKLVLLEISELALYTIEQELRPLASSRGIELTIILGSVENRSLVAETIDKHSIDVILHAAAYKHVPLLETNTSAAISNNIFGTRALAETAVEKGVKRFTLVSTDKAVRPTNVMGASKRFAEFLIQDLHEQGQDTIFSIVRFGNVLGSSGSVIPLFKKQIENGGPVTVTHNDVTRFFMTIPEAARLVLLAGAYAEGGEVFVLDMGEPIKIMDMARQMIELSGLTVKDEENPDGDIEIKIDGLRPGEKLYEELLIGENTLPTPHPKILRAREKQLSKKQLADALGKLQNAVTQNDGHLARQALEKTVEGFKS